MRRHDLRRHLTYGATLALTLAMAVACGVLFVGLVTPASAAVFVSEPYGGAIFASGTGPFKWSFESSHGVASIQVWPIA